MLDRRGRHIEDFIDTHNLVTLNRNQPTYFHLSHNTETAVDLSLSSPCLGTWFDWSIDTDVYDSDHYPIYIRFTFSPEGISSFSPRWKLDRADWIKFSDLCESQHAEHFPDPVDGIQHITQTMIAAAEKTIPTTKPIRQGVAVPWWTTAVRRAIAKRKRAFRLYLRRRTDQNLIARNKERSIAKRVINSAKRESWNSFLSSFTSRTPLSQIWNLVRRLSGKRTGSALPVLRLPGTPDLISEPKEVVNCLAGRIAHTSSNARYPADFLNSAGINFPFDLTEFASDNSEVYNIPFTSAELTDAINSAGNTSVGPDRLHYEFFRHLSEHFKSYILQQFNNLFRLHRFPDSWRESIVAALLKPGKITQNPNNYRPIAMTSCLGKLLERMISKRLSFVLEQQHALSKQQCGFRKNHNAIDHLIRLESDIRKGFKQKQRTTAIFLDIKNAYDMVHRPALIFKIQRLGIRGHLAHYLHNFLSGNRRFRVRSRSIYSDTFETENGLPQGSCLSPLLFNIMIDDLFDDIPPGLSFSLFADDSAMWCTTKEYEDGLQLLQSGLRKVEQWSKRNGLEFSAEKSALMIFTAYTSPPPTHLPKLNNTEIPFKSHFKFLGVTLDRKLSMNRHVKEIQTKCKRRMNLFRCITSTQTGADRSTLLRLYKTIVLPIIEYGAAMYSGGKAPALQKLEAVQNNFLRLALGAMKTSPVISLQVEANIPPLYIRRMDLVLRYYAKIQHFPEHASFQATNLLPRLHFSFLGPQERRTGLTIASRVRKYGNDLDYSLPDITPLPSLRSAPWTLHKPSVSFLFQQPKASVSPVEVQQTFSEYVAAHNDLQFLYTDGSKDDHRTSYAVFSHGLPDITTRLPDHTSIYMAELQAILAALKVIQNNNIPRACICSDSKSAIQSLINPSCTQHLHFDIFNLHHSLVENGTYITFLWIPGHSNINGNDKADLKAKEALAIQNITDIPADFSTIKSSIRRHCLQFWQKTWESDGTTTQLYDIKPVIKPWSSSNLNCRKHEKALAKLRIGHTYLTHSFIFEHIERPDCPRCRTPNTIKHILLHCAIYNEERKPIQDYCRTFNIPSTLSTLLGDEYPELLRLVLSFFTRTNLMDRL